MSKNINETENKTEYASVEDPLNRAQSCVKSDKSTF